MKVPSLSVPATVPKVVSTVPSNIPVSGPVSVKVIVSSSPVTSFTTTTSTVSIIVGSSFKSLSVTTISKVSPGTEVSVISTVPVTPPPTMSVSVIGSGLFPISSNSSSLATVTVSPNCVLKTPSLSVPAAVPKVVSTVPVNIPVSGPVSVKATISVSPVTSLITTTSTVSITSGSSFKSLSVTTISNVSPGIEKSVISSVPVTPP